MECVAPTGEYWRDQMANAEDEEVQRQLDQAWDETNDRYLNSKRGHSQRVHHDWVVYRATTLREARKRGLDISITGLGT